MNEKRLFRQEVFEGKLNRNYGSVLINTPVTFSMLTAGISIIVVMVFVLLIWGEFSEKFRVSGYLESTKGSLAFIRTKMA